MDRSARWISIAVAVLTVSVGAYLLWNPRGQPRTRGAGHSGDRSDSVGVSVTLVDPNSDRDSVTLPHLQVEVDGDTFAEHMARLQAADLEVSAPELRDASGDDLFELLEQLRPYWLSDTLGASVRIDGQLLGGLETLRSVPIASIDLVRLEFSPTEPHWVVRVFLIGE